MISLVCTSCKRTLELDDGFAGGTCRCQFCGTIQTVPRKPRVANPGDTPATAGVSGRSIYRHPSRQSDPPGTGLDQLAEIVASSGLSRSGLHQQAGTPPQPPPASAGKWILFAALAIVLVGLGVAAMFFFSPPAQPGAQNPPPGTPGASPSTPARNLTIEGPAFLNIPLRDDTVIFILDRGSASQSAYPLFVESTRRSLLSLGPKRRYAVFHWDSGRGPDPIPATGLTAADGKGVEAYIAGVDNVPTGGATTALPALKAALERKPAVIVLATAKSATIDPGFADELLAARGTSAVKIHVLSVVESNPSTPGGELEKLATRTGGTHRQILYTDLRSALGQ